MAAALSAHVASADLTNQIEMTYINSKVLLNHFRGRVISERGAMTSWWHSLARAPFSSITPRPGQSHEGTTHSIP